MKKQISNIILIAVISSFIFTLIDWFFHYLIPFLNISYFAERQFLLEAYNNPLFWYSIGKFVFSVIIGIIILLFAYNSKIKNKFLALIYTLLIVIIIQLRYVYTNAYGILWNLIVLLLHIAILYLASLITFNFFRNK
ncbi:hypothetical protein HYW76_01935 [Candidatus Pacearchaeota archaeon]|nr:hypothetical protein [Candidatus Pacearchaeota archaeon]